MNAIKIRRDNVVSLVPQSSTHDEWQLKLLKVAESQDKKAFSELFAHFGPKIKAFAMAKPYTSNPSQFADELIQEVMIKIWNKADNYNPNVAGASTWIFTIARNCRIDLIRKNQRHSFPLESDELFEIEDEDSVLQFQSVQQQNYERDLRECLNQLPHEQAQIIAKVYMEGKSHNEVAEELGLPLGTVKSRVRLALTKLKVMVAH
jgi:RNA polymerase sigma factor (sigma-70 family)